MSQGIEITRLLRQARQSGFDVRPGLMLLLNYKSGLIVCHLPRRCQIVKTINSASFRPHVCSQVPWYVSCYLVNYMYEFIRIFKYLTLWLSLFISGHFLVSEVLLSCTELPKEKMVLVWYSTYNLNNNCMTVVIRSSCWVTLFCATW